MNAQPTPAQGAEAPRAGPGVQDAAGPRPWTPAAAMEPVPPLAPPPARPGAGTAIITAARTARPGARPHTLVVLVAAVLVVVAALILVLTVGH
jgi:hypothetical protein